MAMRAERTEAEPRGCWKVLSRVPWTDLCQQDRAGLWANNRLKGIRRRQKAPQGAVATVQERDEGSGGGGGGQGYSSESGAKMVKTWLGFEGREDRIG